MTKPNFTPELHEELLRNQALLERIDEILAPFEDTALLDDLKSQLKRNHQVLALVKVRGE